MCSDRGLGPHFELHLEYAYLQRRLRSIVQICTLVKLVAAPQQFVLAIVLVIPLVQFEEASLSENGACRSHHTWRYYTWKVYFSISVRILGTRALQRASGWQSVGPTAASRTKDSGVIANYSAAEQTDSPGPEGDVKR